MIPQNTEKLLMNSMFNQKNILAKRYHPYDKDIYSNNNHNNLLIDNTFNNLNGFATSTNHYFAFSLSNASVWLENQFLWNQFHLYGNEMIITKPGRRMFPVLAFSIFGLNPSYYYKMEAEITPADNNRYKYVSVSGWRVNGVASKQEGNKKMYHPDGIQLGDYWQRNGVVFKRIKLTNKKTQKEGSNQIVVNSMHKYEIKLNISSYNENQEFVEFREIPFKETQFIAVTAYQNDDVTQLKIDHNPFAKAFRDTGSPDIDANYDSMLYGQVAPSPFDNHATEQMKFTTNHHMHQKNNFALPFENRFFGSSSNYYPLNALTRFNTSMTTTHWNLSQCNNIPRIQNNMQVIEETSRKNVTNISYSSNHANDNSTIGIDANNNNNVLRNEQENQNFSSLWKHLDQHVFS